MPLDYGSGVRMEFSSLIGKPFSPQITSTSVPSICQQIQMQKPIGGDLSAIIVMNANLPGLRMEMLNNKYPENCLAIVGLLLPAVQAMMNGSSSDRAQLQNLLSPGGHLGVHLGLNFDPSSVSWF
jgi:hypothetical protein